MIKKLLISSFILILFACKSDIEGPEQVLKEFILSLEANDCDRAIELSIEEAKEGLEILKDQEKCGFSNQKLLDIMCDEGESFSICKVKMLQNLIPELKQEGIYSYTYILKKIDDSWKISGTWKSLNIPETSSNRKAVVWESDYVKIYGDSLIDRDKIYYTERKIQPFINFSEYETKITSTKHHADIDFESNPTAKKFKTIITETYQKNETIFAGAYIFVRWGCGVPCQSCAIIDTRDGKVYDGPVASLGYEYTPKSRLLIVNPPNSDGFVADCAYCLPEYWVWDENIKKFNKVEN